MKVSVIIPCFNVEKYIRDCLDSVFAQEHRDIEVICVDNNSTDLTYLILEEISRQNKGMKLIRESKSGACNARNAGLQMAAGEYIQFLDADDLLLPEKISRQIKIVEDAQPAPEAVIGDYTRIAVGGAEREFNSETSDNLLALLNSRLGITSSILWNNKFIGTIGGWNPLYESSQEYELLFRVLKNGGAVAFDNGSFTQVRDRPEGMNISSENLKGNWKTYCRLRAEIIFWILEKKIHPDKMNSYYQSLFDSIRILAAYDLKEAVTIYNKNIPGDFVPARSAVTSNSYLFFYRIFGFRAAEQLKKII